MQGVHGAIKWRLQGQCSLYTILYFEMQQKNSYPIFFKILRVPDETKFGYAKKAPTTADAVEALTRGGLAYL